MDAGDKSCEQGENTIAAEVPASDRITLSTKLLFCAPTVSMLPFVAMFALYGNTNYEKFGASLPQISLFVALARSFDVVSDPLMSYLTDSARSRFGRRIPFLAAGTLPYAIFLFLLMRPPYGGSQEMSTWFGSMYILYFLCNTFISIPYYAMAPELSSDPSQRMKLFLMMSWFEGISTLLAMVGPIVATTQVTSIGWNSWWVCKDFLDSSGEEDGLAGHCFNARTCGHVFRDGVGSSFRLNTTLQGILAPLHSQVSLLPDSMKDCSDWLSGQGGKVLSNISTPWQNNEFCECVVTCDRACEVADERTGFEWVGWLFAGWFLLSMMLLVCCVKERSAKDRPPTPPLVPAMFNTMFNGPFRVLLPAWTCDAFCNAIVTCMTPYFILIIIQPAHQEECLDVESPLYQPMLCKANSVIGACGAFVLLAAILGLPIWQWLVSRLGKVRTWWLWSLTMAVTNLLFVFLGNGWVVPLWVVAALNGLPLGAKFIADAILSDIIDYDEFLTGQRNEATYFMFKGFLPKIVQIPASAVPIALLGVFGYKAPIGGVEQQQAEPVQWYVRAVVLSCFVVSLLAFCIKRQYPLSSEEHIKKLKLGIERHRAGFSSPDPVTDIEYKIPHFADPFQQEQYLLLNHFRDGRIRASFVNAQARRSIDREELKTSTDVPAGGQRLLQTSKCQLFASVLFFAASVISFVLSLQLLSNDNWNFVPTFTSVSVGVSVVTMLLAFCRLRAAKQLKSLADAGRLTPDFVTQVLLRRDLLGQVGVLSPSAARASGSSIQARELSSDNTPVKSLDSLSSPPSPVAAPDVCEGPLPQAPERVTSERFMSL